MGDNSRTINDILVPQRRFSESVKPDRESSSEETPDEYTAFAHGRVGRRPQMMVAFRKCSGQVEVFAYSRLTQIRSENPNRGFTLLFGDREVTIEGQELATLFRYLCEHRAVEIIEADRPGLMSIVRGTVVSEIIFAQSGSLR